MSSKSPSELSMMVRFGIFVIASVFWLYAVFFAHGLVYAIGLLFYVFSTWIFLVPIWKEIRAR